MPQVNVSEDALRLMLKEALSEALEERRDLLHEIVAEVLEDVGMVEAIREGRQTEEVSREEVFGRLRGGA
jgi:hypothetical protein